MAGVSRALILLRTHFVDERIVGLARAYAAGGDYDVAIAVDETGGEVDTQGLPKVSMSLDSCVRLGLNVAFDKPMWRCGDYLFYHARAQRPGYDRYWSIEYDVVLNFADPLDFFRRLDAQADEDYLTTCLEVAPATWHWRAQAALRFAVVWSAAFALVRLSGAAIDRLRERRLIEGKWLATTYREPAAAFWINDEAFVSSAASELGLSMADVSKYGDFYTPQTYMRGGVWHPSRLPPPDGQIYHAVRVGAPFLAATASYYDFDLADFFALAEPDQPTFARAATQVIVTPLRKAPDDPAAVFGPGGVLAALLPLCGEPRVAGALLRALARQRLRLCIEAVQFGRLPTAFARAPESDNVALGRVAWQSSTSARSRDPDVRREAEGGNDGDLDAECGFQTGFEDEPWWAVDFGEAHPLRLVRIYNRRGMENRLRDFVVEASPDFVDWTPLFVHDPADKRRLRAQPIEIALDPPRPARYLRVRLARKGVLQLVEVEAIRA